MTTLLRARVCMCMYVCTCVMVIVWCLPVQCLMAVGFTLGPPQRKKHLGQSEVQIPLTLKLSRRFFFLFPYSHSTILPFLFFSVLIPNGDGL